MSLIADGFRKRAKLTIPAAQVGSGGVSNWSVVIDGDVIGAGHPFWSGVQADGGDARISVDEAGETRLSLDIISVDTIAKTCEMRFGQVSLSSVVDNEFWLWWDHASAQSQPAVGAAFGQHAVYESGLVSYWDMSLTAGAVNDRTSNANHGTRAGAAGANNLPQEVAGKLGEGLDFDGTDDRVVIGKPAVFNLPGNKSVFCWVYFRPGSYITYFLSDFNAGGSLSQGSLAYASGTNRLSYFQSGGALSFSVADTLALNTWHHVGYVRDDTAKTVQLYANGLPHGTPQSYTGSVTAFASVGNTTLGRAGDFSGNYLPGVLDEAGIYNRVLSAAEILTADNNTNSPSTFASLGAEEAVGVTRQQRPFLAGMFHSGLFSKGLA